tara:strand:+ start:5984 stop:6748 length:765 start_codon:yes stop_codon:yes gene_type:complete
MAPRGLKKILKDTVPGKLTGKGKYKGFELLKHGKPSGTKLRGLTKALEHRVWSEGSLPERATRGTVKRAGWKGRGGGRKRGTAVDAQLTRQVNSGKTKPTKGQYTLTKLTLAALAENGLEPVACQRVVCAPFQRVGTAIDVLCYEKATAQMTVVELKCGYSGDIVAPAQKGGKNCQMQGVLHRAVDHTLNRHMAQLACTREMFVRERKALEKMQTIGINNTVGGALLYVNDEETALYTLSDWWIQRAPKIIDTL